MRINELPNPSFETSSLAGWIIARGTGSIIAGQAPGSKALNVDVTADGAAYIYPSTIPVRAGTRYVGVSFDLNDSAGSVGMSLSWRDDSNAVVGSTGFPTLTHPGGGWRRFSNALEVDPPPGATGFVAVLASRVRAIGDNYQVDRVVVEQSADQLPPGTYFDGFTWAEDADHITQWTGEPHASPSVLVSTAGTVLLARLPWRDGVDGFTLDTSRLDADRIGSATVTGFVLDVSRLDQAQLATPAPGVWVPIGDQGVEVSFSRGMSTTGLLPKSEPGTLTASFVDDLDPDQTPDLVPGAPLRLYQDSRALWTGRLENIAVTWDKPGPLGTWGHYRTSLSAIDLVAELDSLVAGPLRDQVVDGIAYPDETDPRTSGGVAIRSRFEVLLDPVPGLVWRKTDAVGPLHGSTYDESPTKSIAAHLDEAAGSIVGLWWVDGTGAVVVSEDDPAAPEIATFTDTAAPSFTAAASTWGTARVATELELTTNTLDAAGQATATTVVVADETARATWGARRASATVLVPPEVVSVWLLRQRSRPSLSVPSITVREIPAVDVGDPIGVELRGRHVRARVASITGTLRPGQPPVVTLTTTERA